MSKHTFSSIWCNTYAYTHPKVFVQPWINVTQLIKGKTRGINVYKEIGIHNINVHNENKYHMDIHHENYEIYRLVVVHKLKNKDPQQ